MEMIKALKEVYDVEDCKYILEGGCVSGCAHSHIYYSQTNSFYDDFSNEIVEHSIVTIFLARRASAFDAISIIISRSYTGY